MPQNSEVSLETEVKGPVVCECEIQGVAGWELCWLLSAAASCWLFEARDSLQDREEVIRRPSGEDLFACTLGFGSCCMSSSAGTLVIVRSTPWQVCR
jgi:hypothetical protein